ncbi:MAG: hypothetical protein PHD05_05725, partial [Sphaerochaetaceae bacterium]|nr:hypothetical protein [Sphaerochaetaceae bacterium]
PRLELFINTVPFNDYLLPNFFDLDSKVILDEFSNKFSIKIKLKEESKENAIIEGNIPFSNFNMYSESFAIRQKIKNANYNNLSIEIDAYGNCKMLIPLDQIGYLKIEETDVDFIKILDKYILEDKEDLKFINSEKVFGLVIGLVRKYVEFLKKNNFPNDVQIVMQLENCFRTALYSKSKSYLEHISVSGIPICMKEFQRFPKNGVLMNNETINSENQIDLLKIMAYLGSALGLPSKIAFYTVFEDIQTMPSSLEVSHSSQ